MTDEERQRFARRLRESDAENERLRALNDSLQDDVKRLKAERHTVKKMLEDILDRHGYSGWDAARTLK